MNGKKMKEMVLGSFSKESLTPFTAASVTVERVPVYKLLGVTINCTLKWDDHVVTAVSKAAKRLWKRAGVSVDDLVHYYQCVIRPIGLLQYACAVWQPALTKEQTQSLENIQRRALQIIFGNNSCDLLIDTLQLSPLYVIGIANCASHCSDK